MIQSMERTAILISYRDEGKEKGKGAFYDHYTVQNHTFYPTIVVLSPELSLSMQAFKKYILAQTINLSRCPKDEESARHVPQQITSCTTGGLLLIPGMARESYDSQPANHRTRIAFEKTLVKRAYLEGRPMIGICAGSWTILEALGGRLVSVSDHSYGGGMPRIGTRGDIVNDVDIHKIKVVAGSLLFKALRHKSLKLADDNKDLELPVNSLHWMAPDASLMPPNFKVSATSIEGGPARNTRQQKLMAPDVGTVEAYESVFGAPVIGFVFHPEAKTTYSPSPIDNVHTHALRYMAQAGDAYAARVKMTAQFKETLQKLRQNELAHVSNAFKTLRTEISHKKESEELSNAFKNLTLGKAKRSK